MIRKKLGNCVKHENQNIWLAAVVVTRSVGAAVLSFAAGIHVYGVIHTRIIVILHHVPWRTFFLSHRRPSSPETETLHPFSRQRIPLVPLCEQHERNTYSTISSGAQRRVGTTCCNCLLLLYQSCRYTRAFLTSIVISFCMNSIFFITAVAPPCSYQAQNTAGTAVVILLLNCC